MKVLKEYKTFEELKSSNKKTDNYNERLKKHKDFENFIKVIQSFKTIKK